MTVVTQATSSPNADGYRRSPETVQSENQPERPIDDRSVGRPDDGSESVRHPESVDRGGIDSCDDVTNPSLQFEIVSPEAAAVDDVGNPSLQVEMVSPAVAVDDDVGMQEVVDGEVDVQEEVGRETDVEKPSEVGAFDRAPVIAVVCLETPDVTDVDETSDGAAGFATGHDAGSGAPERPCKRIRINSKDQKDGGESCRIDASPSPDATSKRKRVEHNYRRLSSSGYLDDYDGRERFSCTSQQSTGNGSSISPKCKPTVSPSQVKAKSSKSETSSKSSSTHTGIELRSKGNCSLFLTHISEFK